jgi:hypothetical protein
MKIEKWLERLEKEYSPGLKGQDFYLHELEFLVAFHAKYHGHEDSAPAILRHAYDLVGTRWHNRRNAE